MSVNYGTRNIVVNGGAEVGPAAQNFGTNVSPQGWISTGTMTAVTYQAGGSGDLNLASSLASQGGTAYFSGGTSDGLSTARQVIDVSAYAARIDAGRVTVDLAAQMGGFASQDDRSEITLSFLAADGVTVLGTLTLTGPFAVDRANISQLLTETGSAALLSGTRSVEVTLTMIRAAGSYNDGYADNISVHLTGLTRGQVLVDGTQDFSSETIAKSTGISFLAGAPAIATFTTAQFGTDLIASAARVEGSSDTDTLTISLAPNDIFSAQTFSFQNWTNGADVLVFTGANGAENLTGSNRADRVAMGAGDDRVAGQAGDDVLDGGAGRDRLRGGGGGDSFVLTDRQNSRDILQDFASGTDLLIVEADSFAAGLTAGALQGDQFVANATGQFTTADQRFAYDTTTGKLWFDLDGSDAAIAVQIATLSGAPTLLVTDFLIV